MSHKSHSKRSKDPHPHMLAICGYSGSGKTTLITKIIRELESQYSIGYVKHDAHRFEMDKEGKDTWQATKAGAERIFINDKQSSAVLVQGEPDKWDVQSYLESSDIVLVEGYKNSHLPKILMLDTKNEMIAKYRQGDFENVVGLVYPENGEELPVDLPRFSRDAVSDLSEFIENYYLKQVQSRPLYGLVLDGGRSTRMGKDKGKLEYHGIPHNLYLAGLLKERCDDVFLSRRPDQLTTGEFHGVKELPDTYLEMGPLGGILSAQKAYPGAAFLVTACDLPFIDSNLLEKLMHQRDPFKFASAYKSRENDFPEPLCAIYEPKFYGRALKFVAQGVTCPRKVLINSKTQILDQGEFNLLYNANSPEDLQHTLAVLKKEGA